MKPFVTHRTTSAILRPTLFLVAMILCVMSAGTVGAGNDLTLTVDLTATPTSTPLQSPVLLAEYRIQGGAGGSANATNLASVVVCFGFGLGQPQGSCSGWLDAGIGGEVSPGVAATYDFDEATNTEFPAFSSRATDGVNETIWSLTLLVDQSGSLITGGGAGPSEASFGCAPGLELVPG